MRIGKPLLLAVAITACGGSTADPSTGGGGGSGGSSSASGSSTTSGPTSTERSFVVSVTAETAPGEAPSLLRLANDTDDQSLAITLPDSEPFAWYAVDWQITTDYVAAALDDPVADIIVSVCTFNSCIRINFEEIAGETMLLPLEAYTLHVSLPPSGFLAELVQDPTPEPFLGVRPQVSDGSASSAGIGTHLDFSLSGQEVVFEKAFAAGAPGRYELLAPVDDAVLEGLTYIDGEGTFHVLEEILELPPALGYTVVVAPTEAEGAVASAPLTAAR